MWRDGFSPVLSCPVPSLQAITALGFKQPTPIQQACVPVGLLGRDLCACAATGTGDPIPLGVLRLRKQADDRLLVFSREDGSIHAAGAGASGLQAQDVTSDPGFGSGSDQRAGDPGPLREPPACTVHLHHHLSGCW